MPQLPGYLSTFVCACLLYIPPSPTVPYTHIEGVKTVGGSYTTLGAFQRKHNDATPVLEKEDGEEKARSPL